MRIELNTGKVVNNPADSERTDIDAITANKCFENLKKHLGSGFAQYFNNSFTVKSPVFEQSVNHFQ